MNFAQAIEQAIREFTGLHRFSSSKQITERAKEILSQHKETISQSKGYDSLSAKRVKREMNPLFKEQSLEISKLATSTAGEYLIEGRGIWKLLKNQRERDVATIIYNEIRERITRGFK